MIFVIMVCKITSGVVSAFRKLNYQAKAELNLQ
jgi:hypothetical protein